MYGLLFILTVFVAVMAVINLPFIIYYLFFFSTVLFSTQKENTEFDEIKEALADKSNVALPLLLPFKMTVLLGNLILKFRITFLSVVIVIGGLAFVMSYLWQIGVLVVFFNWNWFDILLAIVSFLAVSWVVVQSVWKIYRQKDVEEEDEEAETVSLNYK